MSLVLPNASSSAVGFLFGNSANNQLQCWVERQELLCAMWGDREKWWRQLVSRGLSGCCNTLGEEEGEEEGEGDKNRTPRYVYEII